jgi:hypothetical protein
MYRMAATGHHAKKMASTQVNTRAQEELDHWA